ncbi:hypothetical protein Q8A67_023503 [Cirrhinus molitorella]|uniref:Uncharacterized protein n=1 Tax=Cirrhinus molitorella TaxID=172907 RepID=A0AA88P6W1_9TELE|nr:hypothetical protein Q8A67_023503 [Cirrhinus molitorella]
MTSTVRDGRSAEISHHVNITPVGHKTRLSWEEIVFYGHGLLGLDKPSVAVARQKRLKVVTPLLAPKGFRPLLQGKRGQDSVKTTQRLAYHQGRVCSPPHHNQLRDKWRFHPI